MSALEQIEVLLPQLTPDERTRLASLMGTTRIKHTPGVVGGSARLGRTRIAVWMLEEARREGASEGQILEMYPTLSPEDLDAAWLYTAQNLEEIERDIQENDDEE